MPKSKRAKRTPPKSDPLLSAEQARSILQKNVTNIVKKAAAGKPLTAREQETISAFADKAEGGKKKPEIETDWVSSYAALGSILGLHRASFPRLRRDHSDCPKPRANGDHSVSAWRAFLEAHPEIQCKSAASDPAGQSDPSDAGETKSTLELRKLREQCRKIKFDNDLQEALYLLRSDLEAWLIPVIERVKSRLSSKLLNELPPKLEGLRAPQMSALLEPVVADIITDLRGIPK